MPVAVTDLFVPLAMSWLAATSGIQKLAVVVSEFPVSTDSQVVASVPPLVQLDPFQDELAPTHAFTEAR